MTPVLAVLILFILAYAWRSNNGKFDPPSDHARPISTPITLTPELQNETHTCGLHSLNALYRAYGLDPATKDIRFRLGVDARANPLDSTSDGTLHPDIFRILDQDGFAFEPLRLNTSRPGDHLADHLAQGNYALALVFRNTYHWVVVQDTGDDSFTIADSIKANTYLVDQTDFVENHALSIILIKKNTEHTKMGNATAHRMGLQEMAAAYNRQKEMDEEYHVDE